MRESELFRGLSEEELEKVARLGRQETYEAGETIFAEESSADDLYVIESGKVALDLKLRFGSATQRQVTIGAMTAGHGLGWSAIHRAGPFTGTARCLEKTKVVAMDGKELEKLFQDDYRLGYKVMARVLDMVRFRFGHTRNTLAHVLSIASHDLKSPLAAVESYLQVMLGGYAGEVSERQKNMMVRCSERISGLLSLIDDILDMSRLDSAESKFQEASLAAVVESSLENVRSQAAAKTIELTGDLPENLPEIRGIPARLQQLLTNLLTNAVKFTPEGGKVSVRVSEEEKDVKVEVMDTGVGIPSAEIPRIFDDFFRGSNVKAAGAGLGLSIAKKIVEGHRGRLWAESPYFEEKSGKGAKFTFTLPKVMPTPGNGDEAIPKIQETMTRQ